MRERNIQIAMLMLTASSFAIVGLNTAPARAQDASGSRIETVVVTAEKRPEDIQRVPISIVALGQNQLNKTGAFTTSTLQEYVPGLAISNQAGNLSSNTYLRGNGTNQLNAGADPAVAVFEDEVYITGKSGLQFDLLDIDSIDVLKGPQGTLFGRNAASGAIAINSKKPSDDFSLNSSTTIGDNLLFIERANVTGPAGGTDDHLLYRFSVGYERRDGFTTNIAFNAGEEKGEPVDDINHLAARGQLEWTDDKFKFLLSVEGQKLKDGMAVSFISTAADTLLVPFPAPLPPPFNCPGRDDFKQCFNNTGFQNQDLYAVTGRADWTTGLGILTSVTAFRHSRFSDAQDNDGTDINWLFSSFYEFDNQFSEELRLADEETSDTRLHWTTGLYFLNTRTRQNAFYSVAGGFVTNNDFSVFGLHSYAAFGQATYDLTDALSLTGGVRYTEDVKADFRQFDNNFPGIHYVATPHKTWDAFTPAVTVNYKFTPSAMAYFSFRRGWISGGFQDIFPQTQAAADTPFNPETANAYSVGVKSSWFDDRLTANAELFRMDYIDMQVQQTTPGCGSFCIETNNAGAAEDNGLDLSFAAIPIERLTLTADMTIQNAQYTDYKSLAGTFDYTGHRVPFQPNFSAAFAAQYLFDLPDAATFLARVEYNYRSLSYAHPANPIAPGTFQPAYGLLNARVTYTPPSGWWDLEIWGKNLTNQPYYSQISIGANTGGPAVESALASLAEPITFGAQLDIHLQ